MIQTLKSDQEGAFKQKWREKIQTYLKNRQLLIRTNRLSPSGSCCEQSNQTSKASNPRYGRNKRKLTAKNQSYLKRVIKKI